MVSNPFETNREPIKDREIEINGTMLRRYDSPQKFEIPVEETTIFLSKECPDAVGDILAGFPANESSWMQLPDYHYQPKELTPFTLMWYSPFDDGRVSIRSDFSHPGRVLTPFAIFFHVFPDERSARNFISRLPGIYNELSKAYLLGNLD